MGNKILSITEKRPTVKLPNGIYQGIWGGSIITLDYDNRIYELTTEEGVKGIGYKVIVIIDNDNIIFEEIKN